MLFNNVTVQNLPSTILRLMQKLFYLTLQKNGKLYLWFVSGCRFKLFFLISSCLPGKKSTIITLTHCESNLFVSGKWKDLVHNGTFLCGGKWCFYRKCSQKHTVHTTHSACCSCFLDWCCKSQHQHQDDSPCKWTTKTDFKVKFLLSKFMRAINTSNVNFLRNV